MQSVQVGGFTTTYEKIGSGPLLVLLHGWANTWEAWLPILPPLADHFTLIIPNLPGFGESQGPVDGWSTAEYAAWLSEFLKAIQKTHPNRHLFIAGHSFGGKIASYYESAHLSPHIDKLILIDASGIPGKLTPKQRAIRLAANATPQSLKSVVSGTLRSSVYKQFGASSDYLNADASLQKTLRKILSENLTEDLAKIEVPTLIIWGKNDKETLISAGNIFHTQIQGSILKVYAAGHFPHHDHAVQVAGDIIQFLHHQHELITGGSTHTKSHRPSVKFSLTKMGLFGYGVQLLPFRSVCIFP